MGPIGSDVLYQCLLSDVKPFLSGISGELLDPYGSKVACPDAGVEGFRVAALLRSAFSKFEDEVLETADDAALAKFEECNDKCRLPDLIPESDIDALLLGEYNRCLDAMFLVYDEDSVTWCYRPLNKGVIIERARHGPGAAQGATELSDYAKSSSSTLTATSEYLLSMYEEDAAAHPVTAEREVLRSMCYGERIVTSNILSFVPKKRTISRTTCKEAIVNMYYQLGLGSWFEEVLLDATHIDFHGWREDVTSKITGRVNFAQQNGLSAGVNHHIRRKLSQPEINAELARRGSIDGSFATIDLVSASDTIKLRRLDDFPPAVRHWVRSLRSEQTTLPSGRVIDLHMVSTMGNGFTFALQTIIFSSVVQAAYAVLDIPFRRPCKAASYQPEHDIASLGNFGVFGDDIVVVGSAYRLVCRLLNLLGFEVNTAKSFDDGSFRESCGSDWFSGQPSRGVYISSLKTVQDRAVAFNRLSYWCSFTGIPLGSTLHYLWQSVPKYDRLVVPPSENDDAGFKLPFELALQAGFIGRQNSDNPRKPNTGALLYKCFRSQGLTYPIGRSDGLPEDEAEPCIVGFRKYGKWRFLVHNPAGILWSALRGTLRDALANSRLRRPTYQKRFATIPCWDFVTKSHPFCTGVGFESWCIALFTADLVSL